MDVDEENVQDDGSDIILMKAAEIHANSMHEDAYMELASNSGEQELASVANNVPANVEDEDREHSSVADESDEDREHSSVADESDEDKDHSSVADESDEDKEHSSVADESDDDNGRSSAADETDDDKDHSSAADEAEEEKDHSSAADEADEDISKESDEDHDHCSVSNLSKAESHCWEERGSVKMRLREARVYSRKDALKKLHARVAMCDAFDAEDAHVIATARMRTWEDMQLGSTEDAVTRLQRIVDQRSELMQRVVERDGLLSPPDELFDFFVKKQARLVSILAALTRKADAAAAGSLGSAGASARGSSASAAAHVLK